MESGEQRVTEGSSSSSSCGGGSSSQEPNTQYEPPPPAAAVAAQEEPAITSTNNNSRQNPPDRHVTRKEEYTTNGDCCVSVQNVSWNDAFYIAAFGIVGTVTRIYIGRILGGDCESSLSSDQVDTKDFWEASRICITANGLTDRWGGALFLDLPANAVGSFCMGLLSASVTHPIPWLRKDHHLQRQRSWHNGLTTGFCGCLTTFASWNTQMVVMLDGTYAEHGSQIPSALLGYALGLLTAVAAFLWGRVVAKMWQNKIEKYNRGPEGGNGLHTLTFDDDDEEQDEEQASEETNRNGKISKVIKDSEMSSAVEQITSASPAAADGRENQSPVLVEAGDNHSVTMGSAGDESAFMYMMGGGILCFTTSMSVMILLLLFAYLDVSGQYIFYRRLWMTCLFTPVGAVLRSQLKQWMPVTHSVQWGTFTANILGAIFSILLEGILARYISADQLDSWLGTFLWALKVGFAGSLSTVSTFVKELVSMERLVDRHVYGIMTLTVAMSVSLAIYSPLVRA